MVKICTLAVAVDKEILHAVLFSLVERFWDIFSAIDCKSLQEQRFFSKNNFGMGLPGRPTEACFLSVFSVYSDSCFHTKVVSRCVLNIFSLLTFSRWIQHDPFQMQQTRKSPPSTPKHFKVTEIAVRTWEQIPTPHLLLSCPILHRQVIKSIFFLKWSEEKRKYGRNQR